MKNEDRKIPFEADSEYKNQFPGKSVAKEPIKIKDKIWSPDQTPFMGETTYKSCFPKKAPNKHAKRIDPECVYPDGYGFNGQTTYGNSFSGKQMPRSQSCKPVDKLIPKGSHDLSSIYRDSFKLKPLPEACPVLKMPTRPNKIHHPHQHLVYNKHYNQWEEK